MRCVVVGSGITGLTAALLLQRQGHAVTVLEACRHTAPLLRGFHRQDMHFDTGFHCGGGLQKGGVLRRWLRVLGVDAALPDISTTHSDVFLFADGRQCRLPAGTPTVQEAVEAQFPGSGSAMAHLLRRIQQELDASPYLNPAVRHDPVDILPCSEPLTTVLEACALPPHLQAMLAARCLLYGVPPSEASWRDFALVAGPYFHAAGSWCGGGATLAEALLRALVTAGGSVHCGSAVTSLDADAVHGLRAVGLADGTRIGCDRCFFTGHPGQLTSLLPANTLRPAYRHRLRDLPETPQAFMLFAETRDALRDDESLFLLPSLQNTASLDTLFFPDTPSEPNAYLFCDRPAADGRRAVLAITLLQKTSLPEGDPQPRPSAYTAWKKHTAEALRTAIERRLPRLRGAWRVLDAATPLTLRHWIHGSTGSLYGVRHHRTLIPLLPQTRVPGLFLAGQHVLLPGVLGGIVSAALAVGFAFGHDTVLQDFRTCATHA